MKNNLLLFGGIGAVVLFLLAKSKALSPTPQNSVGLASTTSPLGSASGILTPISNITTGLLTGIEAFIPPGGSTQPVISGTGLYPYTQTVTSPDTTQAPGLNLNPITGECDYDAGCYE